MREAAILRRYGPFIGCAAALACGGGRTVSGESESDAGTHGGGTEATATDSGTSVTTATTATTDPGETSGGSGGSGTEDCPAPGGSIATWMLGGLPLDQPWPDLSCLVEDLATAGDATTVDLECGGGLSMPVSLEVTLSPGAVWPLSPGDSVLVNVVIDPQWWTNRWLTIRVGTPAPEGLSPGALVFGAIDSTTPVPPGMENFFAPLTLQTQYGDCVPTEDLTGCGLAQRVGIAFTNAAVTDTVWDQTGRSLGTMASYTVAVEQALEYSEVICDDFTQSWYRAALLATPGG